MRTPELTTKAIWWKKFNNLKRYSKIQVNEDLWNGTAFANITFHTLKKILDLLKVHYINAFNTEETKNHFLYKFVEQYMSKPEQIRSPFKALSKILICKKVP